MHRVVPELIVENYRAGRFSGEFPAVGMFLDLSGFSTMTDTLMQHGQHGAEVLAGLMHGVFNPLVESIFQYGGKIVSFAGDGIMALFPIDEDEKLTALRALASAWVVQQRLMENPDRRTIYGKFTFGVKIGLTIGNVSWQILRSNDNKNATYYFRGAAVDDSANAEHHAIAGEIILTREMNDVLGEEIRTRPNEPFFRFIRFRTEIPQKTTTEFPPVDLNLSRIFMPEEVILDGVRGEFRQIVNLFISIPDLPDEELGEFINVIFELRTRYGGLVTRLDFGDKGCNMLLLWGAPLAFENDIERSLHFILDLRSKLEFPISAGVTYYIAHAGYLGSELCEEYTCYGWGVNLAARFMTNAPSGQVWVDDRIAQRAEQHFEMNYVGSQRFKGFAADQKVHVLHRRKVESDVIYHGEMVGREDELNRLEGFVKPLWQGNFAGVITVSGDAGIGKGRLVHEFASSELFKTQHAHWVNCKADQILRQSLNPFREWLNRYFGVQSNQNDDERKKSFESKLNDFIASISDRELAGELNRTRSILGALLNLRWDDSFYEQLDAEGRYNNTILSLITLIKADSLRQPVILFLDDVQFADVDSITFLTQLKRSILADVRDYPLAVILTWRKEGGDLALIDGLSDSEIKLDGIPRFAMENFMRDVLGGPVSTKLTIQVMVRSEGNPYFAEQIVRYLQEENQLELTENGWAHIERHRDSMLPGDIRALLVARLDKLARDVKNTVQTASVLGREFELGVLSQMLGSESTTRERVSSAESAAIWLQVNVARYIFYHGLLRDAAYSMQMRARRQELHTLALRALEIMFEDELDKHYAEVAYHAEQSDIRSKAQKYYTLAGKASIEQYQNSQAVEYFTKALAFTEIDDIETQFDLLAERVELYSRMGKRELQLADLNALKQRAKETGDKTRLSHTMILFANYYHTIGQFEIAVQNVERAHAYLVEGTNPELEIRILYTWASSLLRIGKSDDAMKQASQALQLARKFHRRLDEGKALTVMGLSALEQKNPRMAPKYLEESLKIAREVKDRRLENYALYNLAISEGSVKGNYSLARDYYEQAYQISREIGDRYSEGNTLTNLGFSAGMQGDLEAASSYNHSALLVARELGNIYQEAYTLINLSAIAVIKNDASRALEYAKQALTLSQKTHDRSAEAWSMLYGGHAYLLIEDYENARDAYENSIAIRNELEQPALAMEPIAGLIETAVYVNDIETASQETEKILAYLGDGGSLEGSEEPLRVYYACYLFLSSQKDPRARQVLQVANQLLDSQVSKFKDERTRNLFVENFPWRRALYNAIRQT